MSKSTATISESWRQIVEPGCGPRVVYPDL
jgi:hypothetical protein